MSPGPGENSLVHVFLKVATQIALREQAAAAAAHTPTTSGASPSSGHLPDVRSADGGPSTLSRRRTSRPSVAA